MKDNETPGKSLKIKQEHIQKSTPRRSKRAKGKRKPNESEGDTKAIKEEGDCHKTPTKGPDRPRENGVTSNEEAREISANDDKITVKEETKEALKPLTPNFPNFLPSPESEDAQVEVRKNAKIQIESDSGEIDMTCKEELMEVDKSHSSSPIRTRRSAFKDAGQIYTAKKFLKENPFSGMKEGNNISMSSMS